MPGAGAAIWSLAFEARGARTTISHRSHAGPLYVQRPFYPERTAPVISTCCIRQGGVVGGDELEIELDVGPDARVLATTPAATKLYRSPRLGSVVSKPPAGEAGRCVGVVAGGNAGVRRHQSAPLHDGGARAGRSFFGLGDHLPRSARGGRRLHERRLDQRFELSVAGRPVVLDRTLTDASGSLRSGAWGWGPGAAFTACFSPRSLRKS